MPKAVRSIPPEPDAKKIQAIGSAIRNARKKRDLSLETVAKKIGKSISTVSRIEAGLVPMEVTTFLSLADAIGFSAGAMISKIQSDAGDDPNLWNRLEKIAG